MNPNTTNLIWRQELPNWLKYNFSLPQGTLSLRRKVKNNNVFKPLGFIFYRAHDFNLTVHNCYEQNMNIILFCLGRGHCATLNYRKPKERRCALAFSLLSDCSKQTALCNKNKWKIQLRNKKIRNTNKQDFVLLLDCNRQTTMCYGPVTNKQMKQTNQKTKQKQTNMTPSFSQTDASLPIVQCSHMRNRGFHL